LGEVQTALAGDRTEGLSSFGPSSGRQGQRRIRRPRGPAKATADGRTGGNTRGLGSGGTNPFACFPTELSSVRLPHIVAQPTGSVWAGNEPGALAATLQVS
jgi:hypothetical protein